MALRMEGGSEELVAALSEGAAPASLPPRTRTMLRFAEQVTRDATQVGEADIQTLRSVGFSDREILDVVHVACLYNYLDRLADALGVELDAALGGA